MRAPARPTPLRLARLIEILLCCGVLPSLDHVIIIEGAGGLADVHGWAIQRNRPSVRWENSVRWPASEA